MNTFILRRISSKGVAMNLSLGSEYTHVSKENALEDFNRTLKDVFENNLPESVYAFISTQHGDAIYPLYEGQQAYIMTESGNTFENVSHRG